MGVRVRVRLRSGDREVSKWRREGNIWRIRGNEGVIESVEPVLWAE
jgi:hypothetical protein